MYVFVRGKHWPAVKQKGAKLKIQNFKMNSFLLLRIFSLFFIYYQEVKIVLFVICTQLTHAFLFINMKPSNK